ncbi:MAG: diguanylate cyclase [Actinomycetia bacterium]|nr:diguanylate cyclase [Actinomycetes bacterium]
MATRSLRYKVYGLVVPATVILAAAALVCSVFLGWLGLVGTRALSLMILGLAIALGLGVGLLLERSILSPLDSFVRQVRALREDDGLQAGVKAEGSAEFELLAEEINHLLAELSESQQVLQRRYREARDQADRDALTGLLNRRALIHELERALDQAERDGDRLAVLLMDIDNFKLFNDTYGHLLGDEIVGWVGSILDECSRDTDVLGRYGGDEFVAILRHATVGQAARYCQRVRALLAGREPTIPGLKDIPITLSFGIAAYPDNGAEAKELLIYADENLYRSKSRGGDEICAAPLCGGGAHLTIERFGTLQALITAVDNKDRYTLRHSQEVATYAVCLARCLGLSAAEERALRTAGLLHDVGKICVPESLLRKPGALTPKEKRIVDRHVDFGVGLIQDVPDEEMVRSIVAAHQECWDGSGYPAGLEGENIPLLARILALADTYSALTARRPYRRALGPSAARRELVALAGKKLDPVLVKAFLETLGDIEDEGAQDVRAPFLGSQDLP